MSIKISIIVPIYNVEKYLPRSLTSLCNQTLKDIEIICIDDCSTDNSLGILRDFEQRDSRIKVITLETNSGAAVARNKGLEAAQGEYLGFIDPDDDIDLNFYETLYNKAIDGDYDIVKANRKVIKTDGTIVPSTYNDWLRQTSKYFFQVEWTTAIYKFKMIQDCNIKFPDEIIKSQDIVFLCQCIVNAKNIEYIDNVYYYYYRRTDSLHTDDNAKISDKKLKSALDAYIIILNTYNKFKIYNIDSAAYLHVYTSKLKGTLKYSLQNNSFDMKKYCAETLIKIYNLCHLKNELCANIKNKKIINLIIKNDINKLSNDLTKYKYKEQIWGDDLKFLEKIFSIKNVYENDHKYKKLTILFISHKWLVK